MAERGRTEAGGDVLRLAGIKTFIDGGVGIGTALFHEPYRGAGGAQSHGVQLQDGDQFEEVVRAAVRHRVQLSQHDSGDAAIDLALDAYERVDADTPLPGRRFVLVHCQFPGEQAMQRIRKLGAVVATQTVFLHSMGAGYVKYLGRRRAEQAMPIRTLLAAGLPVGLGSDAPVNSPDPLLGLWHAEARQERSNGAVMGGAEAIGRAQALRSYTRTNAYLSFDERRNGSLEAGKVADLVVLPGDILTCPLDEVPAIRPEATIVGGKVVAGHL